jgi:hypothetical protein
MSRTMKMYSTAEMSVRTHVLAVMPVDDPGSAGRYPRRILG